MDRELRIAALRRRGREQGITDEEMDELVALSPPGFFRKLPWPHEMGIVDTDTHSAVLSRLYSQRGVAWKNGLAIEVMAITAYIIELKLREWLPFNSPEYKPLRKVTLGKIVQLAKKAGLDPELVGRLDRFVEMRNVATHRLISGEHRYEEVMEYLNDRATLTLEDDLSKWVFDHLPDVKAKPSLDLN